MAANRSGDEEDEGRPSAEQWGRGAPNGARPAGIGRPMIINSAAGRARRPSSCRLCTGHGPSAGYVRQNDGRGHKPRERVGTTWRRCRQVERNTKYVLFDMALNH